jgi:hypothetical protein
VAWTSGWQSKKRLGESLVQAKYYVTKSPPKGCKAILTRQLQIHRKLDSADLRIVELNTQCMSDFVSLTSKFVPTPRKISSFNTRLDVIKLQWRIYKRFVAHISRAYFASQRQKEYLVGLKQWKPIPLPRDGKQMRSIMSAFFNGEAWTKHRSICPNLQNSLFKIEEQMHIACSSIPSTLPQHNLSEKDSEQLDFLKNNWQVEIGNADKNLGPVLFSKSLAKQQCELHLRDHLGTYSEISEEPKVVAKRVAKELRALLEEECKEPGLESVKKHILEWADAMAGKHGLGKFYIIWKLHKAANGRGVMSRPIAPACSAVTAQASRFLHSQLVDTVFSHPNVLKDSLSLVRILELARKRLPSRSRVRFYTADVVALYPSIPLAEGMKALEWYLVVYSKIPRNLHNLILKLAYFILTHNFITCKYINAEKVFLQLIGTAMGTSFSVIYSIIFMIWLEQPVIKKFRNFIWLYKRFIDDIFLGWMGTHAQLQKFKEELNGRVKGITLEWNDDKITGTAADDLLQHAVTFMDLDVTLKQDPIGAWYIDFRIHRKASNSYAYLPWTSYHPKHMLRAWIKAELRRITTHSSTREAWGREVNVFFHLLLQRKYPRRVLDNIFEEVGWMERGCMLWKPKEVRHKDPGCVFSTMARPGLSIVRNRMDWSLAALTPEIFPGSVFFALKRAQTLGDVLRK